MAIVSAKCSYATVEDLFRACVVRIPGRGTGFFVAPNQVLSCAHLFFGKSETPATVIWHEKKGTATITTLKPLATSPGLDLALLEVEWDESAQVTHPCVMLIAGVQEKDEFKAFGHPASQPGEPNPFEKGGDTLSFDYSGLSFDDYGNEYVRAPGERAIGGFSGSPVLNLRTRGVCGILAKSLNTAAPEGGRFLPAELAFKGFPELKQQQEAYHQQDPTWGDFLPGTQLWKKVAGNCHEMVMAFATAFGPDETNAHVPFVNREIEGEFASFVKGECSAMVIVGQSGMGKTTLIHRLLGQYEQQGHLCAVFESSRFPLTPEAVENYVLGRMGYAGANGQEFWKKISLECVERRKDLLVFVDAVNEYNPGRANTDPIQLLEKLDGMITNAFRDYPNIKFVITCRPETWTRAQNKAATLFAKNRKEYYLGSGGIAHKLPRFSEGEMEEAYENYRKARNVVTLFSQLSPVAKYQLRDPLLLSLASDVYSGEKLPEDLDTGEVFDKYYQRLETSHSTMEGIVKDFFAPSPHGNAPATIIRTAIIRNSKLKARNLELYEKLDMTDTDSVGFQLKKQKVLREWTIQPDENKKINELEIQIRFTYDRFAEFLLSKRLLQMIEELSRTGKTRENAAIDVIAANLIAAQQLAVAFGALRRTLLELHEGLTSYSAVLQGITQNDPRALPLVTSVLARIARRRGGIEVVRNLFKLFERRFRMKDGTMAQFPLIDVVYRMLRNEEYRLWLEERPEEQRGHMELLDSYFQWGFKHRDKQVSANAVLYLYFLWRGDAQFAFPDAHRITQKIVARVRRASLFSYLLHWEQRRLLPNVWGLLVILGGELSEADRPQCALETFQQMILNLKLRRSLAFHLIAPLNAALGRYLRRVMKSLGNPVNLASMDAFFAAPNYQLNLAKLEKIMSFFAPGTSPAAIERDVLELSLVENGLVLEMLTLGISACYERQDEDGRKHCLKLLAQLFDEEGAAATTQYCVSLVLYHINYFGTKPSKESLALMGRMAGTILKKRTGRFMLLGKEENFNIIGTYGRALYKNGKILEDGTGQGTTQLALQYAVDALQQSKAVNDFDYYHFVCENIGLLGVLIEPKQVLELISIVLSDFPPDHDKEPDSAVSPADPGKRSDAPFSPQEMAEAYETVVMSLANIRVIYRQEVDRFLLDELESSGLYDKIVQSDAKFNLATFYSWSFEQLMFRVLTRFYDKIGSDVVKIFLDCARSGSTDACLKVVIDKVITRLNELSH